MDRRRLRLLGLLTGGVVALALAAPPSSAAPSPAPPTVSTHVGLTQVATDVDTIGIPGRSTRPAAARRLASPTYRQARAEAAGTGAPLLHDEREPAGLRGGDDTLAAAERVGRFGTGRGDDRRLRLLGSTADTRLPSVTLPTPAEDDGTRALATPTGIEGSGAVAVDAAIGDGPHGSAGDGHGDYDLYSLVADAGTQIEADTRTSDVATALVVYDTAGHRVAATYGGLLRSDVTTRSTFYVLVGQFGYNPQGLPDDPDDPRAPYGADPDAEGAYHLDLGVRAVDRDFYAVDLAKGDVLGATVKGSADTLTIYRPDGTRMISSLLTDSTSLYPVRSPLPGGGNTALAFVADRTGRYAVAVDGPEGTYDATVEDYRPLAETTRSSRVQTIFLDFDGARINTSIIGGLGRGVRDLSPFSAFVARWGFDPGQTDRLTDLITARVRQNLQTELERQGLAKISVKVVSSRRSKDLTGRANVARVIVGGSTTEAGLPPTAWAQFIDPGNFDHEDNAIVLLDGLSDPASEENSGSLNSYMTATSDRTGFVTRAIGDLASHEVGHLLGSFHTDPLDGTPSLMESGGGGYRVIFGVGPDGVGGTADDLDLTFSSDAFAPDEGFSGLENTTAVTSWALVRRR